VSLCHFLPHTLQASVRGAQWSDAQVGGALAVGRSTEKRQGPVCAHPTPPRGVHVPRSVSFVIYRFWDWIVRSWGGLRAWGARNTW